MIILSNFPGVPGNAGAKIAEAFFGDLLESEAAEEEEDTVQAEEVDNESFNPEDFDALSEEATLFGLYTGVPLTERAGYEPALPDRIIVFRRPILESCTTTEEVVQEIRITLWHEVGHFLGLDEDDLHRLGYG